MNYTDKTFINFCVNAIKKDEETCNHLAIQNTFQRYKNINPKNGYKVYDTDLRKFYIFVGGENINSNWLELVDDFYVVNNHDNFINKVRTNYALSDIDDDMYDFDIDGIIGDFDIEDDDDYYI